MGKSLLNNNQIMNRSVFVKNELGMHARPASVIAQIAESSQSNIWLCNNSTKVDASSIIDILTLSAVKGTRILIKIENQKDIEILDQIADFFEAGFEETEE